MASSPEPAIPDGLRPDDGVRWPLVAKLGLALAVLTVVGALIAAVIAAFVVDRDEDVRPVTEQSVALPTHEVVLEGIGRV